MYGYDNIVFCLAVTALSLSGLLAYVSVGPFGMVLVPLVFGVFYILPGNLLKSVETNGLRVALLLLNGMLVGWIPAEYFGNPPLDQSGELFFTAGIVAFAFGFTGFFGGIYSAYLYYYISRTPTSNVSSVSDGTVEVQGDIKSSRETVTAPVSEEDCVAYEYEARQRINIGRGYTTVVESGGDSAPFYVDDGTGRVLVDPDGAKIDVEKTETERRDSDSSEYSRDTTLKEKRVPTDGRIYVFGTARWSDEHGQTVIGDGLPFFKISDSSESDLMERYRNLAIVGVVATLGGVPLGVRLVFQSSGVL
jgi:hypothetical protein